MTVVLGFPEIEGFFVTAASTSLIQGLCSQEAKELGFEPLCVHLPGGGDQSIKMGVLLLSCLMGE